jgi:hypothetical protein
MPHPPSLDDRRAGSRFGISLLVFSALTLSALPLARATEPEATVEAAPAPSAGPLSPVRREAPAAAQSTSSKQTPVAKKPTITMPAPATTPAADAGESSPPSVAKPQPKQAEHATSSAPTPKTANPPPKQAEQAGPVAPSVPKTTKPQHTQAQEATPPRPHRKPPSARSTAWASNPPDRTFPAERRSAVIERRERMVELDRMPRREQVYREEYSWPEDAPFVERRARPYPPPPFYGEAPGDIGPGPVAPPWYYRNRAFASGPYPGMGFPGPGRW